MRAEKRGMDEWETVGATVMRENGDLGIACRYETKRWPEMRKKGRS